MEVNGIEIPASLIVQAGFLAALVGFCCRIRFGVKWTPFCALEDYTDWNAVVFIASMTGVGIFSTITHARVEFVATGTETGYLSFSGLCAGYWMIDKVIRGWTKGVAARS